MSGDGDCQVLVVGAGPSGLVAADLLARAGVKVRIIERRMEATRESRAFAVQARSLELFQAIGLADELIARGVVAPSVNIHVHGKFAGGLNFSLADAGDTPYPFILMVPQSDTEDVLNADVARLGVTVERGVDLVGYEMTDDGVLAQVQHADGTTGAIRCAYIVGADGSRSVVREKAGIAWEGELLPQRFLLADCKVDWPFDHANFRVFLNGNLIGLFMPLKGSACSRVMATDVSGSFGAEDASKPAPLDLEEMEAGMSAALQVPIKLSDPVWVTRYRAHHRNVDRYGAGRAFVTGDAAHIHSPAGGQGMNTGMQDSANLAWKLAAVLNGANPELLASYDGERRPVGGEVVKRTGALFAAAAQQAGLKAKLRDFAIPFILPRLSKKRAFQTKAFHNVSQRGIVYAPDGMAVARDGAAGPGPLPGKRAPDAALPGGGAIFGSLAGYRFSLLALSLDPEGSATNALDAARQTLAAIDPNAQTIRIDAVAAGSDLATRYGLSTDRRKMLYVVRPDGYVGWRSIGWDIEGLHAWLAGWSRSQAR